jgi:thiol:disulfide interchange protein
MQRLKRHCRPWSVVALLLVTGATAAIGAGFSDKPKLLPPEQAFRLSARVVDASTVEARFDVADGYYLYRDKLRFAIEPVAARSITLPSGIRKHDEFFGDVETYRGTLVVQLPLTATAAGQTLTLHADSQGCADAGVCYPPNPQSVKLTVPANGSSGTFVEPAKKGWFN